MSETSERVVDTNFGAVIEPGCDWTPIGHGVEARTVLSDLLGTIRLRYVDEAHEAAVRAQVVDDLRTKAARDWPAIGGLLERIIAVVERGPGGEPQ
ncbi:hypothetical protein B5180_01640 [Streptomyces sp. BF-3]|nr:hypothetical protein B5180_01640 [Streptomyces sp. BF-3]